LTNNGAENRRIAGKTPRPVVVTDHGHGRVTFLVLHRKPVTTRNFRTQAGKEVSADLVALGFLWRVAVPHRDLANTEGNVSDDVVQNIIALAKGFEHRFRKRRVAVAGVTRAWRLIPAGDLQIVKPLRIAHRQHARQHRVHHAENRRIRANAQSKGQHSHDRKPRALAQLT
jgi:hypothetical protein